MNIHILVGNVGADPEIVTFDSGHKIAKFTMATEGWDGKEKKSDWHNIKVVGKSVDFVENYISKGSKVALSGESTTETWEKEGVKYYKTIVTTFKVEFAGAKKDDSAPLEAKPMDTNFDAEDDDLPF